MTRTPDDVKKGLECCTSRDCGGNKCPYFNEKSCNAAKSADALALIQQLEAQNANLNEVAKRLQDAIDQWELVAASPGAVEDMARENTELLEKVEQLQAERDAAVADLADHCGSKTLCKKYDDGTCPHEFDCTLYLSTCQDFEWRGVPKEE